MSYKSHPLSINILLYLAYCLGWKIRCTEYFPYSTYFEGSKSSAVVGLANGSEYSAPENGDLNHQVGGGSTQNGILRSFKDLTI